MEQNRKTILSIKDLSVKFNVRSRQLTAIRNVSLDIYEGEVIAIVGESGSGKSVLTKTFAGMLDSNGYISHGNIMYSNDELSKIVVHLNKGKVWLYSKILTYLDVSAKSEFGAEYFNQIRALKAQYKDSFAYPEEEKFEAQIKELNRKIVDLYNERKNLNNKINKEEIRKIDQASHALKKQKDQLFKAKKNATKVHINLLKKNTEHKKAYQDKLKELEAKWQEAIKGKVSRDTRDRDARIAMEIYLTVNRYPFFTKLIHIRKLLTLLREYMKTGVKLTDEVLNDIFDHVSFRVSLKNIESEIHNPLSKEQADAALKNVQETLTAHNRLPFLSDIQAYATKYQVNEIFMQKAACRLCEVGLKNELNPDRLSWIFSKVWRAETIKKGNSLHGYTNIDLAKIKLNRDWQQIRGANISTVFQDPMTSLNPIRPIGYQIAEVIIKHQGASKQEAKAQAIDLMEKVGIANAEKRYKDYPFQYSGGMRQRIVIAIALASKPQILICDEPTTALDVTIQAQIITLIKDLQKELGFTTIYITHDLGVVASVAERVVVLYAGQIVEYGTVEEIFYDPRHPYTWSLLSSLPQLSKKGSKLFTIKGTPPSLYNVIVGDAFADRNPYALEVDFVVEPPLFKVSDSHYAKTWLLDPRAPKVEPPEIIKDLHVKMMMERK